MTRAYRSVVVEAPADAVWEIAGDFDVLPRLTDRIATSTIVGPGPRSVGAIRRVERADGALIDERLLAYDDPGRSLSYEIVGTPPFGARTYRGHVRVTPVTDGDRSFVEWWGEFDCDAAQVDELTQRFESIFDGFLSGIAREATRSTPA